MTLSDVNEIDKDEARKLFSQCCAATNWVSAMVESRPFPDVQSIYVTANNIWAALQEEDFLEAFNAHPQMGDIGSLRAKCATNRALTASEQAGVALADETLLRALADSNEMYQRKFGFIFVVCATDKSASEILALLQTRVHLSRSEELINAAEEQRKITALRLQKMLRAPQMLAS